jgi:hypothetical protein
MKIKKTTTYFRLITCFLVDYLAALVRINAIIDEGSTDSFITRVLVEELRLMGVDICSRIATIGNKVQTVQSKLVVVTMKSIDGKETHRLKCQMIKEINSNIIVPDMKIIIKQFPWMARFSFHKFAKRPVQMLIGLNGLHLIRALSGDTHGARFEPSIRHTIWGPTMVMRVDEKRRIQPSRRVKRELGVVLHTTRTNFEPTIEETNRKLLDVLQRLVNLEQEGVVPSADHDYTENEKRAIGLMEEGYKIMPNGRASVQVPWKINEPTLPKNRGKVKDEMRRMRNNMMMNKPDAWKEVQTTIKEWLDLKIIRLLDPKVDDVEDGYFTPFVLVFKEERETTKLRICLDFSRKYGYQRKSLNDAVLAGPKLQNSILRILLLFRLNPFAISADVSKMFLSVGMAEQDQKWHRIQIDGNDYQFNNWPFGNAACPFAALFTMARLANNLGKSELTKWIVKNCLYMDDILASVKTKQEAITIYEELIKVYDKALLLFRKWCTSDSTILERIPIEHRSKGFDFNDDSLNVETLGMSWEAKQDVLKLKGKLEPPMRTTMRSIVSTISKVFDPLGFDPLGNISFNYHS